MSFNQHTTITSVIVEGNVGAGKSSFLKILENNLKVPVVYEPHEQWQNIGGEDNLLDKFYKDTNRWAYTFQSYAFITRIMEQEKFIKKNHSDLQILERSVYSDRYCFAKNCFDMGTMNALEWKLYCEWFSWLVDNYTIKPRGFIYLKTDPLICYQRMKQRNRFEEDAVSLDYLQKLHEKHERWLLCKEDIAPFLQDVPVLVLDCNEDFVHNREQQQSHMKKVKEFLMMLMPVFPSLESSTSLSL